MKHHLTARPKGYLTSLRAMKDKFGSLIDFTLVFDPEAKVSFKPVSYRCLSITTSNFVSEQAHIIQSLKRQNVNSKYLRKTVPDE